MGNADLPLGSGAEHARAFERAGWVIQKRRGRGTHLLLKKPGVRHMLSIPDHKEVKRALLGKQLALAGISHDEYNDLFNGR